MVLRRSPCLSPETLLGFDTYKYSSIDTSPVSNYVMHPFWGWGVEFLPRWLAPNLMTLAGFMLLIVNFLLLTFYDPHFTASSYDYPDLQPIPSWLWLVCAVNNFVSHTLDGMDGKQARRTQSSTPLGELFDHGLDSWATMFVPVAIYSVLGRGTLGLDPFIAYIILIGIMVCFVMSHWEKYNTGVLYLPWTYDISELGLTMVYLLTFVGGYEMWKFTLPFGVSLTVPDIFVIVTVVGIFGLTFPPVFWNIYVSYRDHTGKMRTFTEAMRPMVSSLIFFMLMLIWVRCSPYDILEKHTRLVFWATGTIFSNICCHLIVNQMSNTRCELINFFLYPLSAVLLLVLCVPLGVGELYLFIAFTIFSTLKHIHYGFYVVNEMCDHFKIRAFVLKKPAE